MEEQKIKRALAPRVWEALAANLEAQAKRVGEVSSVRIVAERVSGTELRLTNADTGRRIRLSYVAEVPCINFEGFEGGGYWPFKVNGDGTVVQMFDVNRNLIIANPADIAFEIVRALVGSGR